MKEERMVKMIICYGRHASEKNTKSKSEIGGGVKEAQ